MEMDKNPGCQCKLFQFVNTRHPEKAHSNCSKVAAEHEGRGFFSFYYMMRLRNVNRTPQPIENPRHHKKSELTSK